MEISADNYDNIIAKWQDTKSRIENENKKREKKLVVKSKPRIPMAYPLIEPRFYTWKGHREEAAKQFLEELKSEEGNAAFKELIDFFYRRFKRARKKIYLSAPRI